MCQRQGQGKQNTKQQGISERKKTEIVEHDSDNQMSDIEDLRLYTIQTVQSNHMEEIMVTLIINDTLVHMELDTGASVSLVSEKT